MTNSSKKHYLITPLPLWGHLRPGISLIPQLLSRNPDSVITILIPIAHSIPCKKELGRYGLFEDGKRIKIIHYGDEDEKSKEYPVTGLEEMLKFMMMLHGKVVEVYPRLLKCEPVYDSLLKKEIYSHNVPPTVAFLDVSIACTRCVKILHDINVEMGFGAKLVILFALASEHTSWMFLKTTNPDVMTYRERIERILAAPPEETDKVYNEMLGENEDVIELPGIPPFYMYEAQPTQRDNFLPTINAIYESLPYLEAMVHAWPGFLGKIYQKEMKKLGHKVLFTGPLLPLQVDDRGMKLDSDLQLFLDRALDEKGKNSVIYISFGTLMFPPKPHQLSVLLDVLIEHEIRFILVQGVAPMELQTLAREKITKNNYTDKARLVQWVYQFGVLSHEATGWFVTHGGSNSTMEGLRTRTPMLFWPGETDQAWISSTLSQTYKVGYEFLQIRNGPNIGRKTARSPNTVVEGTGEAMRKEFTDIFENLGNERDKEIRQNVEKVGREVDEGMDEVTRESWREIMEM
ncbi:hypothetical protein I302_106010 [Kwoniella bestiolae CBS 10118]|uniref:UDP-glycosyltransferases domain-containing protein n=1 Tax=Kwoniella bestiolae CBS 10118 TaxID=1296100 RepID=A0A1B9G2U0_9TREE|nr:hypothetical protein I302_05134 [Kwoniella bestiolae CBS 10118]OCF25318.1 hypothetical protein I302_05134 [Kwoniella bestiolae CBS 10118]